MKKVDCKKELKHLYSASAKDPAVVDVPNLNFLMIDGHGDPNTSKMFGDAVGALFAVSYTLKFMIKKSALQVNYGVMPLETLWWADDMRVFATGDKESWKWTAMILQPEWVAKESYSEAKEAVGKKKGEDVVSGLRFESFAEGKAAQILHVGPFSEEGPTIEKLHRFIEAGGGRVAGKHHEIYLSDIGRAAPEKWKTIVRQPMKG